MTSFGWKRKATKSISTTTKAFEDGEQVQDETTDPDFDWISVAKRQRIEALEDNKALFERLKREGVTLAQDEKFWQAINRWNVALSLNSKDETVFEMKAQALINLHEWIEAIQAAEEAVKLKANWWVGYQTLGRAQMGIGEVKLALRSFQVAVHLNPAEKELRNDDLDWAVGLLRKKECVEEDDADTEEICNSNQNSVKLRS